MNPGSLGPVVSAAHLADGALPALSEMEYALTLLNNAFHRWIVRCTTAAGVPGLAAIDVLVLHAANHRGREKTQADICLMYNIEDTHVVAYAVKKLEALKLLETGKRGKEKTVKVTKEGAEACRRYREVREELLVAGVADMQFGDGKLSSAAALLRALSGQYDQAARSAASL
ncbi:winged helix DNA-binding protein [Arvimicrobium flavum]|uniref:winged helix DNA-binding protein n=1 Tax=Arvimicrobium flavum TaxID=3393320 RepID=UPI00237BDC81|nr:winged helix DNA-binding protein [Mesorhizobium shangrilense]